MPVSKHTQIHALKESLAWVLLRTGACANAALLTLLVFKDLIPVIFKY